MTTGDSPIGTPNIGLGGYDKNVNISGSNMANSYFNTTNGTSLASTEMQSVVDGLWDRFMAGKWAETNWTLTDSNQTAARLWQFMEEEGLATIQI